MNTTDLHNVGILLDELIIKHSIVERHLGNNAAFIHNAAFEKSVVKIQCSNEAALTRTEKDQIILFLLDGDEEDDDSESLAPNQNAAQSLIDGSRVRKRASLNQHNRYRSMKHLHIPI